MNTIPCFRPNRLQTREAGFTLVEMLTVTGVILIILAASLPALRGFTRSQSRHSAVSSVMAVLDQARMVAIADGRSTYVVFLASDNVPDGPAGPAISANAFGRAYAIFEDGDNINFMPVQRSAWMYLPTSVAFKVSTSYGSASGVTASVTNRLDAGISSSDPAFMLTANVLSNSPNNPSNTGTHLPYYKFDSTGMPDEQTSQFLRLLLFPGYVSLGGAEFLTQAPASLTQLEEIDVSAATGRAKYVANPADNTTVSASP